MAAVHARQLSEAPGAELAAVCGPDAAKADTFARAHGIGRTVPAIDQLRGIADAAIICSPSPLHFEHARTALQAGLSTLVEVPACASSRESEELATLAGHQGVELHCAHTSRYILPCRRVGALIAAGTLGEIRQVHYVRTVPPRQRSWTDDALLHHAAHPLHLLLLWFPEVRLIGCAAHPRVIGAQHVAILAALENGAPVAIGVTYEARVPAAELLIVGERHSISTDGFSWIRSDLHGEEWAGDADSSYHAAVAAQDREFLRACRGENAAVPWTETIALAAAIDHLRALAGEPLVGAHRR